MKKLLIALFVLYTSPCMAQCTGAILDVKQVETTSGDQYRFITQYTCNDDVVDAHGKSCDDCTQGNRVDGSATVAEATTMAEEELARHARLLNSRFGDNKENLRAERIKIYAELKGVNISGKNIDRVENDLKKILNDEKQFRHQAKRSNVTNNLEALKTATVGHKVTVDKYSENYMGKKIEVDASEKITISNAVVIQP